MAGTKSNWEDDLGRWLKPFLDRLGHKARRRMCPLYVAGLIGPGDRKSVQPMAERLAPGDYDQLHHFVSAGVWDAVPLETELLIQADRLVGGSDAVLVIDDTAVPKKGTHSVGVAAQYASVLGKTANCQTLVSLTLARDEVPVMVALRLFLPEGWTSDRGRSEGGVASNYMCNLKVGDKVEVTGPFGTTFLMPNDAEANVIMICTGTGSAPFRAFTERRRRAVPGAPGKFIMFFGARAPQELPYFGPLQKVPNSLLEKHLVFSRIPGADKEYVQDRIRTEHETVAALLASSATHIYICGLKGMETGVEEALSDVCRKQGHEWSKLKPEMRASGRYHIETY